MLLSRPHTNHLRYAADPQVRLYSSRFTDSMEMLSSVETVANHLNNHEAWFQRCAAPMTVSIVDAQSYKLTLGQFGNFGFEVEPTITLKLLPQEHGIYRIKTVKNSAISAIQQDNYDVDFQASMRLIPGKSDGSDITMVEWDLDLSVWVRLPRIITMLPERLVQSSGDHLLRQIVRQISGRLTWKVQEDFHAFQGLKCPKRARLSF